MQYNTCSLLLKSMCKTTKARAVEGHGDETPSKTSMRRDDRGCCVLQVGVKGLSSLWTGWICRGVLGGPEGKDRRGTNIHRRSNMHAIVQCGRGVNQSIIRAPAAVPPVASVLVDGPVGQSIIETERCSDLFGWMRWGARCEMRRDEMLRLRF
jgi:hypothetical protein